MAQVPKPRVREAFVAAAAAAFAERGFEATTMTDVATRAGSSIGNLYKYFPSKQKLFEAAIPPELVAELMKRTRARMRALGAAKDVRELGPDARYHALAGDLLDYCLAHRAAVIVVLARAEGTPFAAFKGDFVSKLVEWALEYARATYPELRASVELRFALHQTYHAFVGAMAEALRIFADEHQARAVIARLTAQHQGGLKRLFEFEGEAHVESRHPPKPPLVKKTADSRARNSTTLGTNPGTRADGARPADRARRPGRRRRARRAGDD